MNFKFYIGRPGNSVEVYSLLDGSLLDVIEGQETAPKATIYRWLPELRAVHGEGHVDLAYVIHGGRRFYDFQKTSPDGSLVIVQTLTGVAILNSESQFLDEIELQEIPLAAHFGESEIRIFVGNGEMVEWSIPT